MPAIRTAILVCVLAASALAAPKYRRPTKLDPKVSTHAKAAEQAWDAAEREPDPAKQASLWEKAATAFAEVDGDPVDARVKRDAAYGAILAWKNALSVDPRVKTLDDDPRPTPRPLPSREVKLLAAIDRYISYADPKDPELPGLLFTRANTHRQFDQLEAAIPMFRTIIERFPGDETAGHAAQLVLDSYNRLNKYDELVKFADELAKNATLLKKDPELAELVSRIQLQAGRKRLELLEKAARETNDRDKYAAAGAGYLELYNARPRQQGGDELLYNAGVMFGEGFAYDAAIEAYTLLQSTYPNSRLVPRMTARWSQAYSRRAIYDKAAELLERYATRYAGERDAASALSDAVVYRKALGDREKAIADTNLYLKNYTAKRPREAADAMWSLTALYESEPDRAVAHLRDYLARYATKGWSERVMIAHAKIGQLLWKQSCSVPGIDGLCLATVERTATCGAGTTQTTTVIARDARKAKLALASFTTAIKTFEQTRPVDDGTTRYFYAQAKLALADAELESSYLAIAMPRDLDFVGSSRTTSVKRFNDWIEQKQRVGSSVTRQYEAVLATKEVASSITAAARLGIVAQSFASSLVTSELPRGVRAGAKRVAYCDAMIEAAAPLEARAIDAFGVCLAKSTELGWFAESSRQCERALLRLRPAEYPALRELHATPSFGIELDTELSP